VPKLTKQAAGQVNKAEVSEGFPLMDEALYPMRLREVNVSEQPGASGFHYWTWVYEIPDDAEEYANRRVWNTTSLKPEAMGMPGGFKKTFAAFGVEPDTDTDELCGQFVLVHIGQEVQQQGKNKGKMQNVVLDIYPSDYEEGGGSGDEPF
jgi:hypothetical protein